MFQEISAAIDYLLTLLHPAIEASAFKQQVHNALETRFAHLWFPNDPTRASALRVLLWHAHGGGEGLDSDILQACLDHRKSDITLAEDNLFSSPFTLWIDPGCVAIRLGNGPGLSFSPTPSLLSNIKVIYTRQQPQHLQAPPMLAVIPSTPALISDSNQGWSAPAHGALFNSSHNNHARSPSTSSMASSVTGSRCTSQSSSYYSSADQDSDSESSLEDMIDVGCYKNFDIIDGEDDDADEQDNVGDVTITNDSPPVPLRLGDVTAPASIVNYDGGNVGVLGGGIRLGGATTTTISKPRLTSLPLASPPALPSPNSLHSYGQQSYGFPTQQFTTMIDGYAIPIAKRVRSRGRRSRGRGAGRAARRQAAAMQANEENPDRDFATETACEDERIMALVRQRAEQVTRNLIKRQPLQERRSDNASQPFFPSSHQQQSQYNHHAYNHFHHHHHQQQNQQQYAMVAIPSKRPLPIHHQCQPIPFHHAMS